MFFDIFVGAVEGLRLTAEAVFFIDRADQDYLDLPLERGIGLDLLGDLEPEDTGQGDFYDRHLGPLRLDGSQGGIAVLSLVNGVAGSADLIGKLLEIGDLGIGNQDRGFGRTGEGRQRSLHLHRRRLGGGRGFGRGGWRSRRPSRGRGRPGRGRSGGGPGRTRRSGGPGQDRGSRRYGRAGRPGRSCGSGRWRSRRPRRSRPSRSRGRRGLAHQEDAGAFGATELHPRLGYLGFLNPVLGLTFGACNYHGSFLNRKIFR